MKKPSDSKDSAKSGAELPKGNSAGPSNPETSRRSGVGFRWFLSHTVRQAVAMRKHVQKILNHQRDILSPNAIQEVQAALLRIDEVIASNADRAVLEEQMQSLEQTANKWLKPYANATTRENVEVLLVALSVAMAVRTFFLQPFKIPTGSMQPTLYGVNSRNLRNDPTLQVPHGWERIKEWFKGVSYLNIKADQDGEFKQADQPWRLFIFNIYQKIHFGDKVYGIWFPPDYGQQSLEQRAGLRRGEFFHKGEDIVKFKVIAGDHLFVDRLTYNFRTPKRGEIVVFATAGIPGLPPDQFYIKRLVGLGGDRLAIQPEFTVKSVPQPDGTLADEEVGTLVVNGKRLSASTPHFENLYSFANVPRGATRLEFQEDRYYGHAMIEALAPGREFQVSPGRFFVMGDNTFNSLDSRYWGDFPATSVIGRALFVYWPVSERFGWGCVFH